MSKLSRRVDSLEIEKRYLWKSIRWTQEDYRGKIIDNIKNIENLTTIVGKLMDLVKSLEKQVQCGAATGHKFLFSKKISSIWHKFEFVCEHCGFTIELFEDQLSPDQTKHLRGLGLLPQEEEK